MADTLTRHDDIFQSLVKLHDGKSTEESLKINAKLVLMLANEIGDTDHVLNVIAQVAAESLPPATP